MLKGKFPKFYRTAVKSYEIVRLLQHRNILVKHSVMIKNSLKRILIETGLMFKEGLESKKGKQKFRDLKLPPSLTTASQSPAPLRVPTNAPKIFFVNQSLTTTKYALPSFVGTLVVSMPDQAFGLSAGGFNPLAGLLISHSL